MTLCAWLCLCKQLDCAYAHISSRMNMAEDGRLVRKKVDSVGQQITVFLQNKIQQRTSKTTISDNPATNLLCERGGNGTLLYVDF